MKLYNINQNQTNFNSYGSPKQEPALKKVSGGEDIVYISKDAEEAFSNRIINMEEARLKKIARDFLNQLKDDKSSRNIKKREEYIQSLKDTISHEMYPFDKKLSITAENILAMFSAL